MRYCFSVVLVALGCALAGCSAFGGTLAVTPDEFGNASMAATAVLAEPEAHWVWTLLAGELVAVVAGWAYAWIAARAKDTRYWVAVTAIQDAVTACYREYVRAIKAAREDGRLTVAEKDEALKRAYETAIGYARTRGVDLLKVFARETVLAQIEKYVRESKPGAVPVIVPLPELAP